MKTTGGKTKAPATQAKSAQIKSAAPRTVTKKELLTKGSDADFRHYIHDMFAFSMRMQEVRNRFGGFIGVSGSQYIILVAVSHLQDKLGVGVNVIAKHLQLSSAFITMEINNLVAAGLVDKATDSLDRRRVRLMLSAEGRQKLEALKAIQAPVNDAIFSSLTREEFNSLRDIQSRLVQHSAEALALLEFYAAKTTAAKTGTYGE
jgi:DNA-binding MarR family transcriptional regulator